MSDHFLSALNSPPARKVTAAAGTRLFLRGDPVHHVYLLAAGRARLIRYQQDGAPVLLHHAAPDSVLAEASLYSRRYHCDCEIIRDATLWRLEHKIALARLHSDPVLSAEWSAHLARALQSTRQRCELLTRNTVAARLDGWLELNGTLPAKGGWKDLAAELGVSPEALYREFSRRDRRAGR